MGIGALCVPRRGKKMQSIGVIDEVEAPMLVPEGHRSTCIAMHRYPVPRRGKGVIDEVEAKETERKTYLRFHLCSFNLPYP